jgi:hypothetical protein
MTAIADFTQEMQALFQSLVQQIQALTNADVHELPEELPTAEVDQHLL